MNKETYNGFSNRSTWLAHLWLTNDQTAYNAMRDVVKRYNEAMQYWKELQERDHATYSYPFHQMHGVERDTRAIIQMTGITKERDYGISNVNVHEVLEAIKDLY